MTPTPQSTLLAQQSTPQPTLLESRRRDKASPEEIYDRHSVIVVLGVMLFKYIQVGPTPVGVPTAMYVPPFDYERGAHASLRTKVDADSLPHTLSLPARTTLEQSLVRTGNITHSGCRVLCSGCPNHSKPSVLIVFLHLDRTNPSYP